MIHFPARTVFPHTTRVSAKGHLIIGGCDTVELAAEYGTPLYLYDEDTLKGLSKQFLEEFGSRYPNTKVVYASKAFINPALARLFSEVGLGLEVVSGGELSVVLVGGVPAGAVYFHGNNKSREELRLAVSTGVGRVVVDNLYELNALDEVAKDAGCVQDVLVRISPNVDPHTHAYISTGNLDSKFGFPIETGQAEEAVTKAINAKNLRLLGLHCHIGSQILETSPHAEAVRVTLRFAAQMRKVGLELTEFSSGGGFGIAYTRDEEPPTISAYADAITATLIEECEALGFTSKPTLVIEPGRSIVGPAGVALYSVGSRKAIAGVRTYINVDGGMGDNIRPALYGARYEAVVANKLDQAAEEEVTISGKFCESGDVLVSGVALPPTEPGDIIAIPASGAYCPAMSSNYNMVARPAIVLVGKGNAKLIRRRESYQDMMASDVL